MCSWLLELFGRFGEDFLMSKVKILFLCTGNACRSQMAEAWARNLKGEEIEAYSAGVEVHGLDPRAVKVMAEVGVDLSRQRSKSVEEVLSVPFDFVITLCGQAGENCPLFPGRVRIVRAGFEDPPILAKDETDPEKALDHYRRVRDEIKAFVETLPDFLKGN